MTLISVPGSAYSCVGALVFSAARRVISSHWDCRRSTSRASSSSAMPSAAVRMITPASSGTIRSRMALSRLRSVSGSLREMPVAPPPGT